MNLQTRSERGATVVRVEEPRLVYASLDSFLARIAPRLDTPKPLLVLDLSPVNYVDSAAIGCLMDLYRRAAGKQGRIAVSGAMARVARMLRMAGAHEFIPMYDSVESAVAALAESGEEEG